MGICVVTALFVKDNGLKALDEQEDQVPTQKVKDIESSATSITIR